MINLHWLVIENTVSVALNLGGGLHGHLALTMTAEDYRANTGSAFVPLHNPENYPQSTGNSQEQALVTEKFSQNQALFRKYTAVDGYLKQYIVTEAELDFLSPVVEQITGFLQVSALTMIQHLFSSYEEIEEIDLKKNAVKMMGPYYPA